MGAALDAFRFLTALPLPRGGKKGDLSASVAFFPLVGAALGGALVFVDWACGHAFPRVSHFLSAALVLAVYAVFTGGLHHDGLMDVADAFWGRRSREERLRIMKDARAGALGVTALALFLLVELAAVYALPARVSASPGRLRWAALLAFPVLGRWTMSYLCVRFPYAREEGTGAAVITGARTASLAAASAIALAALAGCFVFVVRIPVLIAALAVFALAFSELVGSYFKRALGGVTGDCVGAAGMLCEALVLLLLASRVPELLI
ncbi:MAG: adenosylcobinamide-GDP ribazoletransferase [Actinobacteria bacterium]|nr:adenosylcobinamide-GDP ribazoletransferase [Actinomycetota bacterium]